jgi:hypothetical protein
VLFDAGKYSYRDLYYVRVDGGYVGFGGVLCGEGGCKGYGFVASRGWDWDEGMVVLICW